jgi:hypothetical protein
MSWSRIAEVAVAQQATSVIPIVSAVMGDPVGAGLVASLARPGGNIVRAGHQPQDGPSARADHTPALLFQATEVSR